MALVNFNKSTAAAATLDTAFEGNKAATLIDSTKPKGLVNLFEDLKEIQCAHFMSDGSWSMYELLQYALSRFDGPCDVWLTTYSMTELSARVIAKLKDSDKIANLNVLMDYKSKMRYPQVDQLIRNVATRMGLTHLHAKVLVIGNRKNYLTVIGSANWTKNPRVEVGVIDQSQHVAAEHIHWIEEMITHSQQ